MFHRKHFISQSISVLAGVCVAASAMSCQPDKPASLTLSEESEAGHDALYQKRQEEKKKVAQKRQRVKAQSTLSPSPSAAPPKPAPSAKDPAIEIPWVLPKLKQVGTGASWTKTIESASMEGLLPEKAPVEMIGSKDYRNETYAVLKTAGLDHFFEAKREAGGAEAIPDLEAALPKPKGDSRIRWEEILEKPKPFDEPFEVYYAAALTNSPRDIFWLVRLSRKGGDDGDTEGGAYKRIWAVQLLELAQVPNGRAAELCKVPGALVVRDMDGDGKAEIKAVVSAVAAPFIAEGRLFTDCGAAGFIVSDQGTLQARFTREHASTGTSDMNEYTLQRSTTWRLTDINQDGHSDLTVKKRLKVKTYSPGDYVGGGISVDPMTWTCDQEGDYTCLYDVAADQWKCPSVVLTRSTLLLPFEDMINIGFDEYMGSERKTKCSFWL